MIDDSLNRLRREQLVDPENKLLKKVLSRTFNRTRDHKIRELESYSFLSRRPATLDSLRCEGAFERRYWYNTPGPYYCSDTDHVLTGQLSAPHNVLFDQYELEFIFRQPRNERELENIQLAADLDLFRGYHSDGNAHWTPLKVKEWWGRREELISMAHSLRELYTHGPRAGAEWVVLEGYDQYLEFLENELEDYLRVYCFFLSHDRCPQNKDVIPFLED